MAQDNINLLERKAPSGLASPAVRRAIALTVAVVVVGALAYLLQSRSLVAAKRDLASVQAQTERLRHAITEVPSPDAALADRLAAQERDVQALESVAHTLATGGLAHTTGFVSPLQAFGRSKTDGVWLTGLDLDNRRGSMVVDGNALDASRIPALLQTLRADPYFAGTTFSAIEMTAPAASGVAAAPGATGATGVTTASGALKFRISTPTADVEAPGGGQTAGSARSSGSQS